MPVHLLFGDTPYLYAVRFRRRGPAGPGEWHSLLHQSRLSDGTARVLLFCGLRRVGELTGRVNGAQLPIDLPTTRIHSGVTCPRCLVAFDRYLEQGRAEVTMPKSGFPHAHLLFKPSPVEVAEVISQAVS